VLLSSSVGLVPSQWADIAFGALKQRDLVHYSRWAKNYATPAYFLNCLRQNGFAGLAAIHLGMPTANVLDQLLILRKVLGFGKTPRLVVLMLNPRDCLVQPCSEYQFSGSPIFQSISDIAVLPRAVLNNAAISRVPVIFRKRALLRTWDTERFYFSYQSMFLAEHLTKPLGRYCPICSSALWTKTPRPNLDISADWTKPFDHKFDPAPETQQLASFNPKFLEKQCAAIEDCAKLLKDDGIHLLLVEVPLYPGVQLAESAKSTYRRAIESACKKSDAIYYKTDNDLSFEYSDFTEPNHLNSCGGYKLFAGMATYMRKHKTELLVSCSERSGARMLEAPAQRTGHARSDNRISRQFRSVLLRELSFSTV
jgi:hypothetical protein